MKNSLILIICILSSYVLSATNIDSLFYKYNSQILSEKLYVQTDKDVYHAKESIYLKAYLVDAISHKQLPISKYIYVELLSQSDELVSRIKIKSDSLGHFHSAIKLDDKLNTGRYSLVAYTNYMRNNSESCFFRKPLNIYNYTLPNITTLVSYKEKSKGEYEAFLHFQTLMGTALTKQEIIVTTEINGDEKIQNYKSDENGDIKLRFKLESGIDVKVNTCIERFAYSKNFILNPQADNFDVQFMPEGGDLLANTYQKLAFKAINTEGLSVECKGEIFDSTGVSIAVLQSEHNGMGCTMVYLKNNTEYYAEITSGTLSKRFALPKIHSEGASLTTSIRRDLLHIGVIKTPNYSTEHLSIVMHTRGVPFALVNKINTAALTLPLKKLASGITEIVLFDKRTNDIMAKRMVFHYDPYNFSPQIMTEKPYYDTRSKVKFTVELAEHDLAGDYCVSVTDSELAEVDKYNNIVSYLLLNSDLKGHIEKPLEYFAAQSNIVNRKRDLLMMTQGWQRFPTQLVLKDSLPTITHFFENKTNIEGHITNIFGKDPKNASILLIDSRDMKVNIIDLNNNAKFVLTDVDIPDSTTFIIQALGKLGRGGSLSLNLKKEDFPLLKSNIPTKNMSIYTGENKFMLYGDEETKSNYQYIDGIMNYYLDEVTVTASTYELDESDYFGNYSMTAAQLKNYSSIYNALISFPELNVSGFDVTVSQRANDLTGFDTFKSSNFNNNEDEFTLDQDLFGSEMDMENSPEVRIDDVEYTTDILATVEVRDVAKLSYIEPSQVLTGTDAAVKNGIISIRLKPEKLRVGNEINSDALAKYSPLGYKKPVAFYEPKYEVDSILNNKAQVDRRATVAWFPHISPDSLGKLDLEFYTNDRIDANYDVKIEGITKSGVPVSFMQTIFK